jgi:subtilase family serine protease
MRNRWQLLMVGAAVLGTGLATVAAAPASAATAATRVGHVPRIPAGSTVRSSLPQATLLHVDISVRPSNPAGLAQLAQEVSTPGSSLYHHYVSSAQFAALFGPTQQTIQSVKAALTAAGLHPGAVSANHLTIPVTATAAKLSSAFATGFDQYALPGGRVAYANTAAPQLASTVAPYVQSIVGLDDLSVATPSRTRALPATTAQPATPPKPAIVTGGPQPCAAASSAASNAYTADGFASSYGLSSLYNAGDLGAGQTVAVLEGEANLPSDIAAFEGCYGSSTPVTYVKVDGGPKAGAGGGEAALDIEDILSLAPSVSVLDYEAPNTNAAWLDMWNEVVSQDIAKVISVSWDLCEPYSVLSDDNAENTLFQEAAIQGQSITVASGDAGSEACLDPWTPLSRNSNTELAVNDPASQPYATAVGGTTLSQLGPPPVESVWNDGMGGGASGGGISSIWTMPSYQSGAGGSLGVVNADSSGSPCGASPGQLCREVPDVSAAADPNTGYVIYWDGFWTTTGGTSAAAPTWAALLALTDASSACAGATVGFANPALYSVAAGDPGAFNDITSGENDIAGTNGGLFPALSRYDMASGLGSPNGARLAADLCASGTTADPVGVTNPGTQTTDLGQSSNLQIAATDATAGQNLTYGAIGLPAGLSISTSSGLITGVPTTPGVSTVVVVAEDGNQASNAATFSWLVPANVAKLTPGYGPPGGGTTVTIKGVGFKGATDVLLCGVDIPSSSFTVNKPGTVIKLIAPGGVGQGAVEVVGPSGTSPVNAASVFRYGPAVTKVSPNHGSVTGGNTVNISGTNLTGATSVLFGGVPVAPGLFTVVSSKKITVHVPAQAAGAVNVTVITAGGPSAISAADTYTYS